MAIETGNAELLTGLAEAIFGGVIAGLVSWGGIKATLEFHKESLKEIKEIATDALGKAERAITILDERRGERRGGD